MSLSYRNRGKDTRTQIKINNKNKNIKKLIKEN